jgi:hypothetical protein
VASYKSFGDAAKPFGALAKDLAGKGLDRTNKEIGEAAKRIARQAAANDLGGDPKFSGWAPTLDVKYRSLKGKEQGVVISPTKTSAGPWSVAEKGRNRGAGGFAGPGINRRTGRTSAGVRAGTSQVRANTRGATKRWNGYTNGKLTATDAVQEFNRQLLPIVEKGIVLLTKKHLGG